MSKRIAIIGAGATGMTSCKACLEQGLEPVVFEKTNYTGGLWRYKEDIDENGIASVMKSTIINSSKEMSAFSDFPPPPEYPNYMHNSKMVAYFDLYAESFEFLKYVKFRHEVISLELANDYEETGRWKLKARNLEKSGDDGMFEEIFDGVMVCTGHHGTISMPTFPGQEKFKGKIIHTHSLKHTKGFEDQNVVVVGVGNSGMDAAVELSYVTKQVYLSFRRGSWVFNRVGPNGRPFDQMMHRRFFNLFAKYLPYSWTCSSLESMLNANFNHYDYQIRPKHRVLSQHITVNDALPNRILSGTVKVKNIIDHFTEDGVVFKGETKVTPVDSVIMATGYKVSFPFISETILPVYKNKVRLYKYEFIPHLKHPHTLAFISLAQPIGALLPIGEMQARWFSLLMVGKLKLPSRKEMEMDIDQKEEFQKRFYESERHTIQVDWIPFMDELAEEIGCFPPIWKTLFTDPKLFFTLVFGACAPYQYRLVGPNAWPGAREALMTVQERVQAPLDTYKGREMRKGGKRGMFRDWTMMHTMIFILFLSLFFSLTAIIKAIFK